MVAGSSEPRSPRRGIVALLSLGVSLVLALGGFLALASSARETPPTRAPIHDPLADAKVAFVDGDWTRAEKTLRGLPGNDAKTLLGRVLLERGRCEEASRILSEVLKEESQNFAAVRALAAASRRLGKLDLAIVYWLQATKLRKDDPQVWRELAFCQRDNGDQMAASAAIQKSLTLDPNQTDLRELLTGLASGNQGFSNDLAPRTPSPLGNPSRPQPLDPSSMLPYGRPQDQNTAFPLSPGRPRNR